MSSDYPIFPLPLVAFPGCRLPLQIFEPRYLDLVKSSLSNDRSFGVVTVASSMLSEEDELDQAGTGIASIGTSVKIVDFNEQPNGLLGIVCEGLDKFIVNETARADNGILYASIESVEPEPVVAVPDQFEELVHVLESLLHHPYVESLGYPPFDHHNWYADATQLGFYLSYLLPFPNAQRYRLLALNEPLNRLEMLHVMLEAIDHGTSY